MEVRIISGRTLEEVIGKLRALEEEEACEERQPERRSDRELPWPEVLAGMEHEMHLAREEAALEKGRRQATERALRLLLHAQRRENEWQAGAKSCSPFPFAGKKE